jgi:tRNA-Thr(GGU) m(6)t(6)A37 methyltransferase TsaA
VTVTLEPIGVVRHDAKEVPRHWSVSDLVGELQVDARYAIGLRDIEVGERLVVLFHFDRSAAFTDEHLLQVPPTRNEPRGVFSTCSPVRPNPIGFSVVEVVARKSDTVLEVRGLDMLDRSPILDLKPHKVGPATSFGAPSV